MYRISYTESPPFLHAKPLGELNTRTDIAIDLEIRQQCDSRGIQYALIDIREMDKRLSAGENRTSASHFRDRISNLTAVAIVDSEEHSDNNNIFQKAAADGGVNVRFFSDESSATTWLLSCYFSDRGALTTDVLCSALTHYPTNIAILDYQGSVYWVNNAWKQYAQANTTGAARDWRGYNYKDVCTLAADHGDLDAKAVLCGLESVLNNETSHFQHSYPCNSLNVYAWFKVSIFSVTSGELKCYVVSHKDITLEMSCNSVNH